MSDGPDHVAAGKAWQRTLYDGGWAGITWPKEYGGRGGTSIAGDDLQPGAGAASTSPPARSWSASAWSGPTLIAHGTEAQKERYLDPMLRGDEVWCQLFSEPGAGSDLAGLRTRAVRDGDEWVVNGQKVWTSGAHHADCGILLARTDPDAPKHRGHHATSSSTCSTPGIDVRPLRADHRRRATSTRCSSPTCASPPTNVVGEVERRLGRRPDHAGQRADGDRRRRRAASTVTSSPPWPESAGTARRPGRPPGPGRGLHPLRRSCASSASGCRRRSARARRPGPRAR